MEFTFATIHDTNAMQGRDLYAREKNLLEFSLVVMSYWFVCFLFAKVTKHLLLMTWNHWMLIKKNIHKQQMLHCIKALSALVVTIASQADVVKALSAHVMHKKNIWQHWVLMA